MRISVQPSTNRLWYAAAIAAAGTIGATWYSDAVRRARETRRIRRVMVDVLLNALNSGDAQTERHSRRVANLTDVLACAYDFDRRRRARFRIASLLHDMGKIDDRFFHIMHSCAPLDPAQRKKIKQHPHESAHILTPMERLYPGITYIVESHHESWDGRGYPRGLKAEAIPLESRMISVADVFDAMTQPRAYKEPMKVEEVLEELRSKAGERFDPGVIDRLAREDVLRAWRRIAARGQEVERREKAKAEN